jgi:hypothetical protein
MIGKSYVAACAVLLLAGGAQPPEPAPLRSRTRPALVDLAAAG